MFSWFMQIDMPRPLKGHAKILLAIITAHVLFKLFFAYDPDVAIYPPIAEKIRETLDTSPWSLLFPMEYEPTRFYWPVTTLLPLFFAQELLPAFTAFLVVSSFTVAATYISALLVSRSTVFTITMTIIAAFGTHLLYAYSTHNLFGIYFYLAYFSLSLAAGFYLVTRPDKTPLRVGLFAGALLFCALGWEQWVNYAVWIIVGGLLAYVWNRKHGGPLVSKHILAAVITTSAMLVIYLAVRMQWVGEYVKPGSEEELIFGYPSLIMMIDDFISSFFTYIYTAFSVFFPPFLTTSNTIQHYSFQQIIAEQNGYHEPFQHLVPMHHLFYWRYYAGVIVTLFLAFFWRSSFRAWKYPEIRNLAYVLIALMIMFGFVVHMLVKYRPYLSVPALPYKTTMSVFAISVLIAYFLMIARARINDRRLYYGLVWSVWGLIIYNAFTRPRLLGTILPHVGLTGRTDPLLILENTLPFL